LLAFPAHFADLPKYVEAESIFKPTLKNKKYQKTVDNWAFPDYND